MSKGRGSRRRQRCLESGISSGIASIFIGRDLLKYDGVQIELDPFVSEG